LGDATDAGTAEIHWPSGAKETVKLPEMDRIFTITEGKGITGVLCSTCAGAKMRAATRGIGTNGRRTKKAFAQEGPS
jgi:hypothetical protein